MYINYMQSYMYYMGSKNPHEPTIQCLSSLRCLRSFVVVLSRAIPWLLNCWSLRKCCRCSGVRLWVSWETSTTSSRSLSYNRMPRPRSQQFLFVANNSYPAPQLEWFDANNNVVGPSAQCFGIHLLSHSRMGLSQDLGTTKNHTVIIPFPLKSLKIK